MSVGSFLNLCIDRLPHGGSIIKPPSHCESCGKSLTPLDLVPIFSYILLRGRCRHCGTGIPPRILVVEVATASLFPLLAWHFGLGAELAFSIFYTSIFLLIFFIDLEQQIVLYAVVIPGIALAFVFSFFWTGFEEYWPQTGPGITLSALLGGAVGAALMLLPNLLTRGRGMGLGDAYLAGLIGLVVGFPLVLVGLMTGILAGGLIAVSLLAVRLVKRRTAIPFGPFLVAGAMAALVWGDRIINWWWSLCPY